MKSTTSSLCVRRFADPGALLFSSLRLVKLRIQDGLLRATK